MASEPALSYLLTRTALGLALAAGVVATARWTTATGSNTSSADLPSRGRRG